MSGCMINADFMPLSCCHLETKAGTRSGHVCWSVAPSRSALHQLILEYGPTLEIERLTPARRANEREAPAHGPQRRVVAFCRRRLRLIGVQ
jgi:hypothetical protein